MKRKAMYVLIGLVVAFVGVQAYTTMSTKGTPQQPYTVLKTIGELEVRRYPEALTASVLKPGTTYKELSNSGFRSLAGYIFGGNAEEKKIAMTAPVHMEMGADSSRMRFVMPEGLTMDSLPVPNDPNVELERVPEEVVAVLRFGGFSNDEKVATHNDELLRLVMAAGLEPIGPVRFLGYDPPWQLVARRNEVAVAVRWED
ncbi:MAG TPA: heme-binding protein [Flavobacteriales bacterium]|nr:heme-binding protein [Flavobacteriales bacterium]